MEWIIISLCGETKSYPFQNIYPINILISINKNHIGSNEVDYFLW